jgi:hypothetical protein
MSGKLVPKNPEEVMVIRDVVPGVTTLSVPFLRFGLIKIGGRATVGMHPIRSSRPHSISLHCSSNRGSQGKKYSTDNLIVKLTSGSLAVFSPVALTPTVHSKLQTLGGPVS